MTSFTIEYSLIFNLKSFISSNVLYKSNFCVVNIHVPTKLQNWKSAEYRRCPSWYISRYISSFEHWFPKNVVTFLTKISEDYRPDHVHPVITPKSEVSFTCALPKMLHSILVAVFFTYNATSRVFLCFFCENFHFYFLKFLENRSLKEFFPVSMKVLLKAGNIDKNCPCYDSHVFCFPVMAQDGGRKSLICFF